MSRMVNWLLIHERKMFVWANHTIQHQVLDALLTRLTHIGGATFTITATLLLTLIGPDSVRQPALQALVALAASHLPVAAFKRLYPRQRPYLVLPDTKTYKNPLQDHSFPSGHTTAVFSVVVPFILSFPWLATLLLPLAATVGLSRMYLGLHYPSDCLAGAAIGAGTAALTVGLWITELPAA